ncbi:adenylyl-sulfate kinase [Candidatus Poribacteria bacterium]|nr:adenylyl-sulfate kinase [Candidatus Poribacteria bacterium]MYA70215.1 adenylyl-sulfate kinase [Candidatus Poribacteria bacterium]MYH82364.1 adenylyl-sulfate kinase [Candidatus Poribacteria bacterium]MYK96864.1 adenylyl-sulfate kinase [Candidatus Poribacteria bacterium]
MAQQKATNITWHEATVTAEDREKLLNQKGCVIWFTGLSGSGKSTLANAVEQVLHQQRHHTYVLDGDNVRHGLNKNLGFSPEDREENIRRVGEVAKLFSDAGTIVMTAFISPYCADRDQARALIAEDRFVEVFVDCPLNVCEERDTKGLYKKARAGEIKEFTGISAPYEPPLNPEVTVNTAALSIEECAQAVVETLVKAGLVPALN